jgi:hypothetical protein
VGIRVKRCERGCSPKLHFDLFNVPIHESTKELRPYLPELNLIQPQVVAPNGK